MELKARMIPTDFEAMLSVQIVLTFFALIYFLYFRAWNYQTYIMFRIEPRNKMVKMQTEVKVTKYSGRWLKNKFLFDKI